MQEAPKRKAEYPRVIWLTPEERYKTFPIHKNLWILCQKIIGEESIKILDNPHSYTLFSVKRPTKEERKINLIGKNEPDLIILISRKFTNTEEMHDEYQFFPGFVLGLRTHQRGEEVTKENPQELDVYELIKISEILGNATHFGKKATE